MSEVIHYNPDVLSCLANLSNDEVFTPPGLANEMLDLLPPALWQNKDAKFLDPFCKTGVFLREITRRLNEGLKTQIPDAQERINHILTKQVYGIAITQLTALISRRSVYCSKWANGPKSVCTAFTDEQGNICYSSLRHTWNREKCVYCGASQDVWGREGERESHAYALLHMTNEDIEKAKEMKFDVIVGNPPYQLSDGGAQASASPLYHLFVQQAKKLKPRYLTMIIPARWYAGGKGLQAFREEMLSDRSLIKLVDYVDSNECFPGVDLSGGNCYFLWDRDKKDDCLVTNHINGKVNTSKRPLLFKNYESFIRFNQAVPILEKVFQLQEKSFSTLVSSRKPFGIPTVVNGKKEPFPGSVKVYAANNKIVYVDRSLVTINSRLIGKLKIYISYAYGERGGFPYLVLGKPFIGERNSGCTETYLVIGEFATEKICEAVISYLNTRFFRFLVLLKKNTQHATQKVYEFVPIQDFSRRWSDVELYKKYGLSKDEVALIESLVRPMEGNLEWGNGK